MLLTITTTHEPATDLGFLLAKNPNRIQSFNLSFGKAHVYYPQVDAARCTAALLLDLDPLDLVKSARRRNVGGLLTHYVNDRPYVASSFMSVAISRVFGSALGGRSRERPELAATAIPLEATVAALPARGGVGLLRELFEPLGYQLDVSGSDKLDLEAPQRYWTVTLRAKKRLSELLRHLYVLIPVLDDEKHYWVGDEEIDKLLAKGSDWLKTHPLREQIANRYLKRQRRLTREALARLTADEDTDVDTNEDAKQREEARLEEPLSLDQQRIGSVLAALREAGATRVLDVGCGEGKLLRVLFRDRMFTHVAGMDVSMRSLEKAKHRLKLDEMPAMQRERIELFQSSLAYKDDRLAGYDAACAVEVIEHIDVDRIPAFERALFAFARPGVIIVTTPNIEHNVRFESLPAGKLRHRDHRFEWTRAEFRSWSAQVSDRWGYTVRFVPIGTDDPEVGPPTQMVIFTKASS